MKQDQPNIHLKKLVLDKYNQIGKNSLTDIETYGCCGPTNCCTIDYEVFADDYTQIKGYNKDADLGLGCGMPTEFAKINPGDTVVDLGSGAGNDCFVASQLAGKNGQVIGVDFSPSMIQKARENATKIGFMNVKFIHGDIEELPLEDEIADVVISNCVLNLVPDKKKAFSETYRVLKHGSHFSISDVVTIGDMPETIKKHAEMYAGCVSGAVDQTNYLNIVKSTGFKNLNIMKIKKINLPDELLTETLSDIEYQQFISSNVGIYSITLYGEK